MSSIKDTIKTLEARLAELEAKITELSVGGGKKARRSKSSDSGDKPKREFKPSEARDAWFALCTAVRAVHKKNAMKIAKLLKADGHMNPTPQQIEDAVGRLSDPEADNSATSAVEESAQEEEEKQPTPKPAKKSSKSKKA